MNIRACNFRAIITSMHTGVSNTNPFTIGWMNVPLTWLPKFIRSEKNTYSALEMFLNKLEVQNESCS